MNALRILVVGGGVGGMSAAISLARAGHAVSLIDLDPGWRVYGAGITITGPTLRALDQLGVLGEVARRGYAGDGLDVRNVRGDIVNSIPTPVVSDKPIPGSGGIMRPVLHDILASQVRASGIPVGLGVTVDAVDQAGGAVQVRLSTGEAERYDLLVGADGVFSRVRTLVCPDAPRPEYTGQGCWRVVVPRTAEIERRCYFLGGPVKVGLTPVSRTEMYMFLLERWPEKKRPDDATLHVELARLLEGYGGALQQVRQGLSPASNIIYRPLEGFLMPPPWSAGRVQLIGDAVHPTTPQLASGAGLAIEDGIILAEEVAKSSSVEAALQRFMQRRWERCRLVVETSLRIGQMEQAGEPVEVQTGLVQSALAALAEPA